MIKYLSLSILFIVLLSCSTEPSLVGTWVEVKHKQESIHFHANGTFEFKQDGETGRGPTNFKYKITETKLPSYQEYIEEIRKNHEHENLKYLIQSDESDFIEEMMNALTQSFYFKDEIRTLPASRKGQVDNCITDVSNFEFTQNFLAIVIIMSKCKFVYCNSGNISIWIRIYRELNEGFNQWIFWNNERLWFKSNQ